MVGTQLRKQVRLRRVEAPGDGFDGSQLLLFAPEDPRPFADDFIAFLHDRLPWSRFAIAGKQPPFLPEDKEGRSSVLIEQSQPRYSFEKIFVSFVVWQNTKQESSPGEKF